MTLLMTNSFDTLSKIIDFIRGNFKRLTDLGSAKRNSSVLGSCFSSCCRWISRISSLTDDEVLLKSNGFSSFESRLDVYKINKKYIFTLFQLTSLRALKDSRIRRTRRCFHRYLP